MFGLKEKIVYNVHIAHCPRERFSRLKRPNDDLPYELKSFAELNLKYFTFFVTLKHIEICIKECFYFFLNYGILCCASTLDYP